MRRCAQAAGEEWCGRAPPATNAVFHLFELLRRDTHGRSVPRSLRKVEILASIAKFASSAGISSADNFILPIALRAHVLPTSYRRSRSSRLLASRLALIPGS